MNDIDISTITPKEREIEIMHPATGEPLGITVTVMSADDSRLKRHQRQLIDRRQERQRRNKFLSAQEMEFEMVKLIANAIVGWDFKVKYQGEIPAFSTRKAIEMLSDPNIPWFFEQINAEMGDTKAFF